MIDKDTWRARCPRATVLRSYMDGALAGKTVLVVSVTEPHGGRPGRACISLNPSTDIHEYDMPLDALAWGNEEQRP